MFTMEINRIKSENLSRENQLIRLFNIKEYKISKNRKKTWEEIVNQIEKEKEIKKNDRKKLKENENKLKTINEQNKMKIKKLENILNQYLPNRNQSPLANSEFILSDNMVLFNSNPGKQFIYKYIFC